MIFQLICQLKWHLCISHPFVTHGTPVQMFLRCWASEFHLTTHLNVDRGIQKLMAFEGQLKTNAIVCADTNIYYCFSFYFGLMRSTWIMAIVETISYAQLICFQSHYDLSFHFIWSHFNDESRFFLLLSLNTRPYFVNSINKYHVHQKQKKNRLNVFFIRIYSSWNGISKHGPDDPIDNCGLIMTDDDIAWIFLQAVILLGIIRWSILCSTSMKTSQNLRTICWHRLVCVGTTNMVYVLYLDQIL